MLPSSKLANDKINIFASLQFEEDLQIYFLYCS